MTATEHTKAKARERYSRAILRREGREVIPKSAKSIRVESILSANDWLGLYGELLVFWSLSGLKVDFEHHFTFDANGEVDASAWKDFTGHNPDAQIYFYLPKKHLILETKNNSGTYEITQNMVKFDIVPRFRGVDLEHTNDWLLIVAHPRFTQGAKWELTKNKVGIVSFGGTATADNQMDLLPTLVSQLSSYFAIMKLNPHASNVWFGVNP